MALTPSTMNNLGFTATDFKLTDVFSETVKDLNNLKKTKGLLVMFICNHCPYVVYLEKALITFGNDYKNTDIGITAISSNDISTHPDDAPNLMSEKQYPFPYLYDETQDVARGYDAACTPDFFLFDNKLHCVYRGQFDSSRPGNNASITGNDLRAAMDALLEGKTIDTDQKPSIGCNIKWKT